MSVSRKAVGAEVQRIRKLKGFTGEQLASILGCTQSLVSKVENGRIRPDPSWIEKFCKKLSLDRGTAERLSALTAEFLMVYDRWGRDDSTLQALQLEFKKREEAAKIIQSFSHNFVNGLLQTEDYAKQVFASYASITKFNSDNILEATRVRMRRQASLHDSDKMITIIQSEAALVTSFPSEGAMVAQIDQIAALIEAGRAEIRILPMSKSLKLLPVTDFTIFDEAVVEIETASTSLRFWEKLDVEIHKEIFKSLLVDSVSGIRALEVLERRRKLKRAK